MSAAPLLSPTAILIPIFACIAVGVAAGAARLFTIDQARVLSRFVFLVAMPVAVLDFMQATEAPGPAYFGLVAGYMIAMLATTGVTFALGRRVLGLGVRDAGAGMFAATLGNAVFLGLPIALSVEAWGPPFLVLMLLEGLFVFALGTAAMTWPEDTDAAGATAPRGGVLGSAAMAGWRAARNPIVMATLAGFALAILNVQMPGPVIGFLGLFGGIAGPAGLFILGLFVALLPREGVRPDPLALGVLLPVKLVLFPALAAGLVWAFTRDADFTAAAALLCAMPPAVGCIIQSAHYRAYEAGTAALVAVGTLIGLGTVSTLLVVLLRV